MSIEEELKQFIVSRYGSVREFATTYSIPYSTIATIFSRGVLNAGISSVFRICDALSISVDELADGRIVPRAKSPSSPALLFRTPAPAVDWFCDALKNMSDDEKTLIKSFRSLNPRGRASVLSFMDVVLGNPAMLASAPPSENNSEI